MPYIEGVSRKLDLHPMGAEQPENPGELNFCVTQVVLDYAEKHGHSYAVFNDVLGALEGAKLEFYRRLVAPYEDMKRLVNGDVY